MNFLKGKTKSGFTLVELVVSLAIFVFLTALLLAKYGTFNQGVLLTNLAYDVALIIRTAQSYGLNVKSAPTTTTSYSSDFSRAYGVYFDVSSSGSPAANTKVILYMDSNDNGLYDSSPVDEKINVYNLKRGSKIYSLCGGPGSCSNSFANINITFKRPEPDATMIGDRLTDGVEVTGVTYLQIILRSSNNVEKKILVHNKGRIRIFD